MSMWRPLPRTRSARGKTDHHGEFGSADTIGSLPHLHLAGDALDRCVAGLRCKHAMQPLIWALIDNDPGPCEAAGRCGKS